MATTPFYKKSPVKTQTKPRNNYRTILGNYYFSNLEIHSLRKITYPNDANLNFEKNITVSFTSSAVTSGSPYSFPLTQHSSTQNYIYPQKANWNAITKNETANKDSKEKFIKSNNTKEKSLEINEKTNERACFTVDFTVATPSGETPIQSLKVGDDVFAYCDKSPKKVKIIRIGHTHINAKVSLPNDQAGYPVRILKNAIADEVPYKDLLITPEHCLFLNGNLVPARMLVNGRSIFYDRSITSFTHVHIQTETPSTIMANGLLIESYLANGNRLSFHKNDSIAVIANHTKSQDKRSTAPAVPARHYVEPLFAKILQRAKQLHTPGQTKPVAMTTESDFHLISDTGLIIHKTREVGGRSLFMIPSAVTSVRLVSRSSRPCDTIGPFVDDRRQLGVCVGDVTFYDSGKSICLSSKKGEKDLEGWYPLEKNNVRWTNGNALLPLAERSTNSLGMLAIEILAGGPYLLEDLDSQHSESLSA